jgi:hypothetical protein
MSAARRFALCKEMNMTEQRKTDAPKEFEEAPDVGGPGQAHSEQTFGKQAERESRSDLRDERGGATDPIVPPPLPRVGEIPVGRAPHADTDPRRPAPEVVDSQPEGLKRERKDPLSPSRGRAAS